MIRFAGTFMKFIDGHRPVGDIFRMSRKSLGGLDSDLFTNQFNSMFHAFHACNNMYLTYNRPKYKELYYSVGRKMKPVTKKIGECTTKRCKLKHQQQELASAVDDYKWKQASLLELGLHIQNLDGYTKGKVANMHA